MAAAKLEKLLILADCHAPFHDARAWKLVMRVARHFQPETIIHLGDLADFYSVSAHSKDPNRVSRLEEELDAAKKLRADMDRLGAKRKVFICGNHEHRLTRYLQDKAPELNGLISIDGLLELSKHEWRIVDYRDHIRIGKVYYTHDIGGAGKYPVARAVDTFQHSICMGHHHCAQTFIQGNATGQHMIGSSFGWLGDSGACDYMHRVKARRSWSLGFGIGYMRRDTGVTHFQSVPLVNYACVCEGKLFKG